MIEVIFLGILALVWIVVATVQDLKSREIANWLNFSLIAFALGFRFFFSLFSNDFQFFYQGLIGLGIFFVLGNLLYYGKMFAGGDAKLMIALGAILPLSTNFLDNARIFVLFFFLFLFVGALYGFITGLFFSIKNFGRFKKEFSKQFSKKKNFVFLTMFAGLALMAFGFSDSLFFGLGILVFISAYFYIYAKSVDESSMVKNIKTGKLREGDWLYHTVKVGGKTIAANWDGLSKKDISLLRKKKKTVMIREGIPFTPVFLISFLILLYVYLFNQGYLKLLF